MNSSNIDSICLSVTLVLLLLIGATNSRACVESENKVDIQLGQDKAHVRVACLAAHWSVDDCKRLEQ